MPCKSFVYISDIFPLSDILIGNIFSQSVGCFSHFLEGFLWNTKVFSFDEVQFICFSFCCCAFVSYLRNHWVTRDREGFHICCFPKSFIVSALTFNRLLIYFQLIFAHGVRQMSCLIHAGIWLFLWVFFLTAFCREDATLLFSVRSLLRGCWCRDNVNSPWWVCMGAPSIPLISITLLSKKPECWMSSIPQHPGIMCLNKGFSV